MGGTWALPTASENILRNQDIAWEEYSNNRGTRGLVGAYFHTLSQCIGSPSKFFTILSRDPGDRSPALFGAVSIAIPAAFTIVWIGLLTGTARTYGFGTVMFLGGVGLLVAFVAGTIGLFLGSSLVHGCLMILQGNQGPFRNTLRVVCYSQATSLFGSIPLIGYLVGGLWGFYLCGIGLRETHHTSTGKAFAAVLIPVCVFMAAWVIFGLGYNPLTSWHQSSSAVKPVISPIYSGTEFRTDASLFSITAPLPLKEKKVAVSTALGKVDMFAFSAKQGNVDYAVAYSDSLPPYVYYLRYLPHFSSFYDPEKVLDKYGGSIATKFRGTIVSETKIKLDNNPGREIVIETAEKLEHPTAIKARAFLVKNRLYQIIVVAPHEELSTPAVDDFFVSFKLLGN